MRWRLIWRLALWHWLSAASIALAQNPADDSFLPVIVERPDTISITTNSDPDIFPGLRPLPPERFT